MGLLERCNEFFKTSNLYEVLGIDKEATEAEIRRGYYKVSLSVHPDRAPEDPLATEKFQVLGKLYAVLSDKEQRVVYDEQGVVDEESDVLSQDRSWEEYWRLLFPKFTMKDIVEFEKKYKDSDEEREDLIKLYVKHEGDLDAITASALCYTQEDEPRLCSIIQDAIQNGEVEAFPAFTKESDKKKRSRRKRQRQKSREQSFNGLLSDLEAKYCKPSGKSQKAKRGKK
ncbi:dnaJ homolog subfamily C member 9 [Scomber scombrus]|uniref:DnaJ homolog subfamily C member 9 n=1 Tax=Scomber scombrus TaxID=13677 RepID=A0AAV1N1W8_SCOSC